MKLTTKARYAVTAMLDLAVYGGDGPVTLGAIARRQNISQSYLEQLFAKLRARDLVGSTRGPGGGYALGRRADDIAIAEIIAAVDETVETTGCQGQFDCSAQRRCLSHDLWASLSERIRYFFEGISLGELQRRQAVREVARRQRSRARSDDTRIVALKP